MQKACLYWATTRNGTARNGRVVAQLGPFQEFFLEPLPVPSGNAVIVIDSGCAPPLPRPGEVLASTCMAAAGWGRGGWGWLWTAPPSLSSTAWTLPVRSDCSKPLPIDDLAILLKRKRGSPFLARRVVSLGAPWAKTVLKHA
jgi:hypothetical protein